MKITPLDIHHKKFKTGFKGYSVDEVDHFLDEIAAQLDVLYKENTSMKEKMNESEALVNKYKDLEGALNSALVNAQKLAQEVVAKANTEADSIVSKAKREAKEIFDESVEQRNELMQSIKRLQKLDEDSKTRLLNVLEEFTNVIQGTEAAVDENIISKEEDLSERLDQFIKDNSEAETRADASEEIEEVNPIAALAQTAAEKIVETPAEKSEERAEKIETKENGPETEIKPEESVANSVEEPAGQAGEGAPPAQDQAPAIEKIVEIKTDNIVSNAEKSLLLTANGHTQEFGPEDNPFADLGEGVPGAIRRKKKIND